MENHKSLGYEEFEKKEDLAARENFKIFGIASVIYTVIFTFCLYKNFSGITNSVWVAATVVYMTYIAKKLEKKQKGLNIFYSVAIIVLGISNFLTDNYLIIFLNYVGILLLIAVNMVSLFKDMKRFEAFTKMLVVFQSMFGCIANFMLPFSQMKKALQKEKDGDNKNIKYTIIGVVCAVPVLIIIGTILASADSVFRNMISNIFRLDVFFTNLFEIAVMLLIGYMVPYAFSTFMKSGKIYINEDRKRKAALPVDIVMGTVAVMYVVFSVIQIVYLFRGNGNLPGRYTYAEYARQGFFQLLFLSFVNAVAILICIEFVSKSRVLKGIFIIICGCTLVMIASSGYRMKMYIGEYGLTFTRVFVLWALVVIALVILGLAVKLVDDRVNLFSYIVVAVTCCFMVLSLSHVDYFIAKYNLERYAKLEEYQQKAENLDEGEQWEADENFFEYVDMEYITSLSADSVPAVLEHKNTVGTYFEQFGYYEKLERYRDIGIRDFNVSRYIAGK